MADRSGPPRRHRDRAEPGAVRRHRLLVVHRGVASETYIAVNTVKTHLTSIDRKLAATRRDEAVRRACQLELIYVALAAPSDPRSWA